MSRRNSVGVLLILLAGLIVFISVSVLADNYLNSRRTDEAKIQNCAAKKTQHLVTINNNLVSPDQTFGNVCDTLTIKNNDNVLRLIGFGQHDHHEAYDGIYQYSLAAGQSFTITLNKAGSFSFHDHFEDSVYGSFTVTD